MSRNMPCFKVCGYPQRNWQECSCLSRSKPEGTEQQGCCPRVGTAACVNAFSTPVSRAFIFWQNKESSCKNNWEGCHDQGPSAAVAERPWESWQRQPATSSVRPLHCRCYRHAFAPDLAHQQPDSWGEEGREDLEGKHRWAQFLVKLWLIHHSILILLLEFSKSALDTAHIAPVAHFQSSFHGKKICSSAEVKKSIIF